MLSMFVFNVLCFFVSSFENDDEFCVRVCFSFFVPTIENDEELCVRVCLSVVVSAIENDEEFCVGLYFSFFDPPLKMARKFVTG